MSIKISNQREKYTPKTSEHFWQAKIWGLLHSQAIKFLPFNTEVKDSNLWSELKVMKQWQDNNWNPKTSQIEILQHIGLAEYITLASHRIAIDYLLARLNHSHKNYPNQALEIAHLLSGKKLKIPLIKSQDKQLNLKKILKPIQTIAHPQTVFWWLWRCLPISVCQTLGEDETLLLMPTNTHLPDECIWSHTSITATLAGALAGYDLTTEDIQQWPQNRKFSRPLMATFSFSPVLELVKASRTMGDVWAGSWVASYLSAKVCWKLAQIYGPDSFVYPSLYQQPLIDYWILATWPEFANWVQMPSDRQLLTASFPNVLLLVLPQDQVQAAMQTARQTLLAEWENLGDRVWEKLQTEFSWMPNLDQTSKTWNGWLGSQWQTYWSAFPIGDKNYPLTPQTMSNKIDNFWINIQNKLCNFHQQQFLFSQAEIDFFQATAKERYEQNQSYPFAVSLGSWWPHIFKQTNLTLSGVKSAKNWVIPTAFGPRSTVSGVGSVVHPDLNNNDWITEADAEDFWQHETELFDGIEELNATETLKRGLHKVLPDVFNLDFTEENFLLNSPQSWYVLGAGNGDNMQELIGGKPLKNYHNYCSDFVQQFQQNLQETVFQEMPKTITPASHITLSRGLSDFSNQLVPYLTEKRYGGRLIYGCGDEIFAYLNLREWDNWLWDIRQCFQGRKDPQGMFDHDGNYWRWRCQATYPRSLANRPLFTLSKMATISFGIVVAHPTIPLDFVLENMWDAQQEAKQHQILLDGKIQSKDAVQVRVLYENGNVLPATAKFSVFHQWQQLIRVTKNLESSVFEEISVIWHQHPPPTIPALRLWTKLVSDRYYQQSRNSKNNHLIKQTFQKKLADFLQSLWLTTSEKNLSNEIQSWLQLASFFRQNQELNNSKIMPV